MGDTLRRLALLALCALAAAGCGGGERQDADAPSGSFALEVSDASFPARQRIAKPATLRLDVANTGERDVPELAVTVETEAGTGGQAPVSFGRRSDDAALASSARPVWVLDSGPTGGDSAYANTWAVGPLPAGRTRTLEWKLTAVRAGRYTVAWRLAPALEGDVELADGRTSGQFDVTIADDPVAATVNGDGDVVRDDDR